MMQRAWIVGLLMALAGCTLDGLPYPVRSPGAVTDGGTDTGVAICALGQTNCGTGCVNTSADPANCGGCGRVCGSGMACAGGACVTACAVGQTNCAGSCAWLTTDPANCGGCGHACAAGQNCANSVCACPASASSLCNAGTSMAGCRDLTSDPANCGGCGRVCGSGMACAGGACVAICPTGTALCGGTCVNTGTDTANCGVCGRVCAAGTTCAGGACSSICVSGQAYCGGACTYTATDIGNCGSCGHVCALPGVSVDGCVGGSCTVGVCASGYADCNGYAGDGCEVSTSTNGSNCGSCGHACAAGQTCSGGACSTGTCPSGMAVIPGGTFMMGAADLSGSTPVHTVTLTSYCMDVTEVTVAAYATCPSGTCTAPVTGDPCNWMVAGRDNHPINCVTWDQSRAYCQWVHGGGGDLPTEAQWEYAAAGGAMDWEYPWGNDAPANQLCWSGGSAGSRSSTCPVMSFPTPADAFGLFDMAGNVWEWTGDWDGGYSAAAAVDPAGPSSGTYRVIRGGSWNSTGPSVVRAAVRYGFDPSIQDGNVGFRCARPL